MNIPRTTKLHLVFATLFLCNVMILAQDNAGKLFEKALYLEESEGNLQEAISIYEKIIKDYNSEVEISAKAQLHIGFCYEKQGKNEAIKAYEKVIEKYAGQQEQVAIATARLKELKKESPRSLTIINLGGWDKPGMIIQPFGISEDGDMGLGMEYKKGQNVVAYDIETKEIHYITDYTWGDDNGYYWTYHPVMSSKFKEVAFYLCGENLKKFPGNSLVVANLKGETRILATSKEEYFIPNDWMPNGSAILTIKGKAGNGSQLGFYPINGGNFILLVNLQKDYKNLVGKTYPTATVSPDGNYILYTDAKPGEKEDIYIVNSDGSNSKILSSHPAAEKYPRWSPDGKYVVFLSQRHGNWALWGINIKNGEMIGDPFMIKDGMNDSYLMNWTKNGIATWDWITMNDIYLMEMDPLIEEPIAKPKIINFTPSGTNLIPVWSHNGKSIAFRNMNKSKNMESTFIVSSGTDYKSFRVPTNNFANFRWRPDDKCIALVGSDEKFNWSFYCLNLETEKWELTQLPIKNWALFDWCDNGESILLSQSGNKGAEILKYNLKTRELVNLYKSKDTSTVMIYSLFCSNDFKKAVFVENRKDFMIMNLETNKVEMLDMALKGYFSWSPEGNKFLSDGYFTKDKSKQSLYIVPISGGLEKEINLSDALPEESIVMTPDWTSDGRRVAFTLQSTKSEVLLLQNLIATPK